MTQVILTDLTKQFSGQHLAVDHLSLEIPTGKLTAVLGPSGCGKTTILKMIAGILTPTCGDILFNEESQLSVPAERRGAVMVFQNHLLFPFLSVGENIAFGLKMRGEQRSKIEQKVIQMLELVQLTGFEHRKPSQLSGGQQQRVALARALVVEPRVLLLDEPLSNLDAHLRDEMRELILVLQRQKGITTVFVTHDQEEAVILADRLALILEGRLQQVAEPRVFFERPANLETAIFFGAKNCFPGNAQGSVIQTDVGPFRTKMNGIASGPVQMVIRPESICIQPTDQRIENCLTGTVQSCIFTGTRTRMKVRIAKTVVEVVADASAASEYRVGEAITIHLPAEKLWAFPVS